MSMYLQISTWFIFPSKSHCVRGKDVHSQSSLEQPGLLHSKFLFLHGCGKETEGLSWLRQPPTRVRTTYQPQSKKQSKILLLCLDLMSNKHIYYANPLYFLEVFTAFWHETRTAFSHLLHLFLGLLLLVRPTKHRCYIPEKMTCQKLDLNWNKCPYL